MASPGPQNKLIVSPPAAQCSKCFPSEGMLTINSSRVLLLGSGPACACLPAERQGPAPGSPVPGSPLPLPHPRPFLFLSLVQPPTTAGAGDDLPRQGWGRIFLTCQVLTASRAMLFIVPFPPFFRAALPPSCSASWQAAATAPGSHGQHDHRAPC